MRQSHTDIGKKLKQIRIDKDIDLKDIEKQTNINIKILNFIEKGEFYRLPKGIFARSFVKQYCVVLDLNPDEFMGIIFEGENEEQPVTESPGKGTQKEKTPHTIKMMIAVCFIIILVIFAYRVFNQKQKPSDNLHSETTVSTETSDNVSQPLVVKDENPPESSLSDQLDVSDQPPPDGMPAEAVQITDIDEADTLIKDDGNSHYYDVIFSAEEDCWIKWESGSEKRDLILKKGETVTYTMTGELTLTLGNAPALKVYCNNRSLSFPKDRKVLKDYKMNLKEEIDKND